jgi:hypothetical protein
MDTHGIKTLEELVKLASGPEKKKLEKKKLEKKKPEKKKRASWKDRIPFAQVPSTRKQDEKMREQRVFQYGDRDSKAHGGYVKKYAKGGGVRKVRI